MVGDVDVCWMIYICIDYPYYFFGNGRTPCRAMRVVWQCHYEARIAVHDSAHHISPPFEERSWCDKPHTHNLHCIEWGWSFHRRHCGDEDTTLVLQTAELAISKFIVLFVWDGDGRERERESQQDINTWIADAPEVIGLVSIRLSWRKKTIKSTGLGVTATAFALFLMTVDGGGGS